MHHQPVIDTGVPWALYGRPGYPLEDTMPKANSPATATAADDQTEVRTAEAGTPTGPDEARPARTSPREQPEPDSHDDLVARVARLEQIVR